MRSTGTFSALSSQGPPMAEFPGRGESLILKPGAGKPGHRSGVVTGDQELEVVRDLGGRGAGEERLVRHVVGAVGKHLGRVVELGLAAGSLNVWPIGRPT